MKLKRFVLMGGSQYYACGGFEDYISSFDTMEEARESMNKWLEEKGEYHWAHIGDLETGDMEVCGQAEATAARFLR